MNAPLSKQQLAELTSIAKDATNRPFFLSDCEGLLQVWVESALTHVTRDESGEITGYSTPSSYRPTDQVLEIGLDSWDLGEDVEDDVRRRDVGGMVGARAALPALLAEVARLRASAEGAHRRIGEVLDYLATKDAVKLSEDAGEMGFHIVAVLDGPGPTAAENAERRAKVERQRAQYSQAVATVARLEQKRVELERIANAERERAAELEAERRSASEALAEAADEVENLLAEHESGTTSCHAFGAALAQMYGRWRTGNAEPGAQPSPVFVCAFDDNGQPVQGGAQ